MPDVTMLDQDVSSGYPPGQYQLPQFTPARSRSQLNCVALVQSQQQHDNMISLTPQDNTDVAADAEKPMDICEPEPQSLRTLWPEIYAVEPLSIKRKPVGEPVKTTIKPSKVYDVRPPTNNRPSQQPAAVERPRSQEVWVSSLGSSTRPDFAESAQTSDSQMGTCFSTPSKALAPQGALSDKEEKARRKAARNVERQKLQAELADLEKRRKHPMPPPVLRALAPKKLRNSLLEKSVRKAIDPESVIPSEWTRRPKLETAFASKDEFSVDGFIVLDTSARPLPKVAPGAFDALVAAALNNGNDVVRYAHTYKPDLRTIAARNIAPGSNCRDRLPSNFAPFRPNHAGHRAPANTEEHAFLLHCSFKIPSTATRRYYSRPEAQYLPSIAAHSTLLSRPKDPMYDFAARQREHAAQHAQRQRERQVETTRRLGGIMTGLKKRLGPEAQYKRLKESRLPMHQQPIGGRNWVRSPTSDEKKAEAEQAKREGQQTDQQQQEVEKKDPDTKLLDEYEAAFHVWEAKMSLENGGKAVGWWEDRWKEPEMKRFAVQEIPKFGGGGKAVVVKQPGTETKQQEAKGESPVPASAPIAVPAPLPQSAKEPQEKPPMEVVRWKLPLLGKLAGGHPAHEEHFDDFEI
ncbi:uncharacterized protein AB675_2103 [Cyphellophora attinorum]|uniref:Uncharacterized protein n=1 Tax=Cyphellophora attinorum TaxID=1664694 RepID=A0A0N1HUF9_9EURO|nr:uncharacterized protein AB675_2103 [Phialophora attinorum]KPI43014.1 hypothetical protein AB675_2103 [Phialophora attinorum]